MRALPFLAVPILVMLILAIWQQSPGKIEPLAPPKPLVPDPKSPAPAERPLNAASKSKKVPQVDVEPQRTIGDQGPIYIGPPMDPDDPSTWPPTDNTQLIDTGQPMDPNDPSTWPQSFDTTTVDLGEPIDPDDPSTWPQPDSTEVVNIGEPLSPDGEATSLQPYREPSDIGERMFPSDPQ